LSSTNFQKNALFAKKKNLAFSQGFFVHLFAFGGVCLSVECPPEKNTAILFVCVGGTFWAVQKCDPIKPFCLVKKLPKRFFNS
jgi:hypothetical protein